MADTLLPLAVAFEISCDGRSQEVPSSHSAHIAQRSHVISQMFQN
jgi:hypothetical protein